MGGSRRRTTILVAAIVLLAWSGYVGWSLLRAHADIEAGRDLVRGVQVLTPSELLDDGADAQLAAANDRFAAAVHRLGNPIVAPARLLPWAGRQLRSTTAMAVSARDATGLTRTAVDRIADAVGAGVPAGAERPAALHEVAAAAGDLRDGLAELDLGPDRALIGKLAEARAEFTREIDDLTSRLDSLATVTTGLADSLDGPHRYLVLAANNAQMQNGQGMFLEYALLETDHGEVRLSEFDKVSELPLPATPVELDSDIAAAWPWMDPNDDWRHLGTTARFPSTAATAQRMWAAIGRPPVDGVLSVDVVALRALLTLTGPVTVDGRTIDAGSAEAYLLHDQYTEFFGTGPTTAPAGAARDDRERAVARAALDAVSGGVPLDLSALSSVGATLAQRHLMAWSSVPEQQAAFEAAGIDGSVPDDGLLVSVVNRSGNKLDWFLDVATTVDVESTADADTVTLTVTLHNAVDPALEPRYVAGPYADGLAAGQYLGVVTATLPGTASDVTVDGGPVVVAGRDGPSLLYGARVLVDPGGDATVVFRFAVGPGEMAGVALEPSGRAREVAWSTSV
jgi:hypothetical protein